MPTDPLDERLETSGPIRKALALLHTLVFGGLALGAAVICQRSQVLVRLGDPETGFWAFEGGCAGLYLASAFGLALLAEGRTSRESAIAAGLACLGQTVILWLRRYLVIHPPAFALVLVGSGSLAWLGAWLGHRVRRGTRT
jgi:hypothetical protein